MSSYSLVHVCDGCKQRIRTPQTHQQDIRTLPCFHTLCNKCISEAYAQPKPRCPRCKKEWNLAEMRRFTCCSVCKYFRKQAVSRCLDCKKDMCHDCELKHMDYTLGSDHQVLAIPQQFAMDLTDKIRETGLEDREDPFKKADLASCDVLNNRDPRDTMSTNLPGLTCTSKLQLDTTDLNSLMSDKQAMVDIMVQDTESQMSFFSDIMDANPDLKENMESTMNEFVQEGITQVQDIVHNNPWDSALSYEISVTGKPLDPTAKPEIHVTTKSVPRLNFRDMTKYKFHLKTSVPIDGNARRVYKIHNRIFVSTWESFFVYTLDCDLVSRIVWAKNFETSSAVPIDLGIQIIADFEQGVFMIGKSGNIMQKICGGHFSDVDTYDDKVYALEYKKCLVKIFKFIVNVQLWQNIEDVALKYDNVTSGDTVRAFKERLYVCSSHHHCVFVYNLKSGKYRKVGKYGRVTSPDCDTGVLFYPRITMADFFGNSLIADSWNQRMLVLHDEDTWANVDFSGQEGEVWDVYLEQGAPVVWMISFIDGEYRLLQFEQ